MAASQRHKDQSPHSGVGRVKPAIRLTVATSRPSPTKATVSGPPRWRAALSPAAKIGWRRSAGVLILAEMLTKVTFRLAGYDADLTAAAVADLYSRDPDTFTERRKELAAAARAASDREAAQSIAALRKPTRFPKCERSRETPNPCNAKYAVGRP